MALLQRFRFQAAVIRPKSETRNSPSTWAERTSTCCLKTDVVLQHAVTSIQVVDLLDGEVTAIAGVADEFAHRVEVLPPPPASFDYL